MELKRLVDRLILLMRMLFVFDFKIFLLMYNFSTMITSIRNGEQVSRRSIVCPVPKGAQFKKLVAALTLLRKEGYIRAFTFNSYSTSKEKTAECQKQLIIYLKYDSVGKSALRSAFSVSTPGRRVYVSASSF